MPASSEPGQVAQEAYVETFQHRYGGNVPRWKGIGEPERQLWVLAELRIIMRLADDARALLAESAKHGPDRPGGD